MEQTNVTDTDIQRILSVDPLADAERLAGKSYKENDSVMALGVFMAMAHGESKRDALAATRDSHRATTLREYLEIVTIEGFREVLALPFAGGNGEAETLYVFWHPEGILLKFDTWSAWGEPKVNGGNFYYNWTPNEPGKWWFGCLSSGGWVRTDGVPVYAGDHDCREAIRFHLRRLRDEGRFLKPWLKPPFIWLLHYMDTKGTYDYRAINATRIAMLPEDVQHAIKGDA